LGRSFICDFLYEKWPMTETPEVAWLKNNKINIERRLMIEVAWLKNNKKLFYDKNCRFGVE
jgi:hypothetical protein